MTGWDITALVFLGWWFGFVVGAVTVAWFHDTRAEERARGAYTARNPTPLNALELQAPKGKV